MASWRVDAGYKLKALLTLSNQLLAGPHSLTPFEMFILAAGLQSSADACPIRKFSESHKNLILAAGL